MNDRKLCGILWYIHLYTIVLKILFDKWLDHLVNFCFHLRMESMCRKMNVNLIRIIVHNCCPVVPAFGPLRRQGILVDIWLHRSLISLQDVFKKRSQKWKSK